jgi:hypothetical protein
MNVFRAAKADIRGTHKRRLCVGRCKQVGWFVLGSAKNEAFTESGLVPNPFLHIAGHVVVAPKAYAGLAANGQNSTRSEIAGGHDESGGKRSSSAVPAIDRGQALAGEFGIGGGFVPADAGNRKTVLTLGILTLDPILGAGLSGSVVKQSHCRFPREGFSVLLEINFPELGLGVAALIDEILKLAIGDFVLVNPMPSKLQTIASFNLQVFVPDSRSNAARK